LSYFVVHLTDGTILDFNKKCKYIYSEEGLPSMLICSTSSYSDDSKECLGVISIDHILYIESIDHDDC